MKLLSYHLYKPMIFLLSASLGNSADLRIYCGSLTNYTSTKLEDPLPLLTNTCFDENRKSVVYAHGLNQSPEDPTAQEILASFIALLYNVFAIDWSEEASTGFVLLTPVLYPAKAVPNAIKVGKMCGDALNIMSNYKLNIENTNGVGHSLGAHVVGECGKQLLTFNKHLQKIDGLDPAGPGFEGLIALDGLDKTSGKCVIVHHTNPGVFGTFDQVGHKDIWYNCNKKYQPKCDGEPLNTRDKCSHLASCDYYAEAIVNPTNFAAVPSSSCSEWQSMDAATAAYIYINDDTDCTGDNGNYFLSTNGQSPYGRSLAGIYADNDPSVSF